MIATNFRSAFCFVCLFQGCSSSGAPSSLQSNAGSGGSSGASATAGASSGGSAGVEASAGAGGSTALAGAGGIAGQAGSSGAGGTAGAAGAVAFPGAVGWAADTPGGRGGAILRVTTLAPTGAGSLAAAIGTPGPRIIVFEVGGVIDLAGQRFEVVYPNVTIAGQTAPSPGITIVRGGLLIRTSDVVVRHLRVRPGEAGHAKTSGWEVDSISTTGLARDVIVDHCSATWGTDENLSASGERFAGATPDEWRANTSHRVTFSNNIVAEGLSNSTHAEGEHSKGGLIHDNTSDIAIYGNLYFSNLDRHPLFKGGARGVVVNNYVANYGKWAMMYALNADEWDPHPYETGWMSIVGNVVTPGPSSPNGVPLLRISGAGKVDVYFEDNLAELAEGGAAPNVGGTAANANLKAERPLWPEGLTPMKASEVAAYIEANVGARPWDRDATDARIVAQALAGEGTIIDSESEVEGYPSVTPTSAPFVESEWDLDTMERKDGVDGAL